MSSSLIINSDIKSSFKQLSRKLKYYILKIETAGEFRMPFLRTAILNESTGFYKIIQFRRGSHFPLKRLLIHASIGWICILSSGFCVNKRSIVSFSNDGMAEAFFDVFTCDRRIFANIMPLKNILIRIYSDISCPICHGL